jgi:hypothetical protein
MEDIEKIRGDVRAVREKRECLDALVESRFSAGAGPLVVDVPDPGSFQSGGAWAWPSAKFAAAHSQLDRGPRL